MICQLRRLENSVPKWIRWVKLDFRYGSMAAATIPASGVRFTPESCHAHGSPSRQLRAINGLMHRNKRHCYSMTSSATRSQIASTVSGVAQIARLIQV
jgi:hypothetical protein